MAPKLSLLGLQVAFLLAVAYCVNASPVVGGLNGEIKADEQVSKLVEEMREQVEDKLGHKLILIKPLTYRKQVVAGVNYFVKAAVTSAEGHVSHMHMRIYKPFKGPAVLSAIRKDLDESHPLEYFQ